MNTQRWTRSARTALARLEVDRRDPIGRGLLGEAWEHLAPRRPDWLVEAHDRLLVPHLPVLPVHTPRLVLRLLTEADLDDLHDLYRRPEVVRYLLTEPKSRQQTLERILEVVGPVITPAHHRLVLGMEHEGRLIGELTLVVMASAYSVAEVGWVIHPDLGGRGLATEAAQALVDLAFTQVGVHRVIANLDPRNERSAALCVRLAMELETSSRQDLWSKGEWTDTSVYALLRDDL